MSSQLSWHENLKRLMLKRRVVWRQEKKHCFASRKSNPCLIPINGYQFLCGYWECLLFQKHTFVHIIHQSVYLDWSSLLWSKQRLIVCRILHLIFWSWSVILMSVGDITGQLTAICSWPFKVSVWLLHAHFCVFQNVWLLPACGCTRPPVRVSVWPAVVFKSNHFYCHITTAHVPWWVKFLRACSRQYRNNLHIDSTYLDLYRWVLLCKQGYQRLL